MTPFHRLCGVAAPMDADNIDTDQIIPLHQLTNLARPRGAYGSCLFHNLRFEANGAERPEFILNHAAYRGAVILVAGANFGCGSSREMAVWALLDFGVRVVIAPSFGDIFLENCAANGLLAVSFPDDVCEDLRALAHKAPGATLEVDLADQVVRDEAGRELRFEIDGFRKESLLRGLDALALTLEQAPVIAAFERVRDLDSPWLR